MDKYNIPGVRTFEYSKIIGIENIEFGKHIIVDDFAFVYAINEIDLLRCTKTFANQIIIGNSLGHDHSSELRRPEDLCQFRIRLRLVYFKSSTGI